MTSFYVAAYTISPSSSIWDPAQEASFFKGLSSLSPIAGIEHPYTPWNDRYPSPWLFTHLPPHWTMIITLLPAWMWHLKKDPLFGLASVQEESRQAAVALVYEALLFAKMLEDKMKRPVIKAFHLHTAPTNIEATRYGSKEALIRSLHDIKKWDWGEIDVNIEHCDAFQKGIIPQKGYLSLDDELNAIREAYFGGIVLNWARSVIEAHDKEHITHHQKAALARQNLRGFFFSGCASESPFYGEWRDTHMPPSLQKFADLTQGSLLGPQEIETAFSTMKGAGCYYGIKITDKSPSSSEARSLALIHETLDLFSSLS